MFIMPCWAIIALLHNEGLLFLWCDPSALSYFDIGPFYNRLTKKHGEMLKRFCFHRSLAILFLAKFEFQLRPVLFSNRHANIWFPPKRSISTDSTERERISTFEGFHSEFPTDFPISNIVQPFDGWFGFAAGFKRVLALWCVARFHENAYGILPMVPP